MNVVEKYPKYNLTEEAFTLVVLGTTRKKQCKQNSFYIKNSSA